MAILNNCWHRLLPVLAALLAQSVFGQGIIYVHAPLSNPNDDPNHLPWDSLGTQVGPDYSIIINGQTVLTFSTPTANGQPTAFVVNAPSTSAVIAFQPNLQNNPLDPTSFTIPLSAGQLIGSDAAGYDWLGGGLFTASTGSGIIGDPFLTIGYFTGLESAYLGFDFQQDGETYYGWAQVGCPITGLNVGWVYDYAYETIPNIPIAAGAVPEPSISILISLSALTFYAWRRRK